MNGDGELKDKYNIKNPSVKRILKEMKENEKEESDEFVAEALEDNIFEWHFVIRGPSDTEFENGIYHGRIILPSEYPFKPPSFIMLTKNGRFEIHEKICLSISDHHPEEWQPSWSVRTALIALIAFFPTEGKGALKSLDLSPEQRRELAKFSRKTIPKFADSSRQKIADKLHNKILSRIKLNNSEVIEDMTDSTIEQDENTLNEGDCQGEDGREKNGVSTEQSSDTFWHVVICIIGIVILLMILKKIINFYYPQ